MTGGKIERSTTKDAKTSEDQKIHHEVTKDTKDAKTSEDQKIHLEVTRDTKKSNDQEIHYEVTKKSKDQQIHHEVTKDAKKSRNPARSEGEKIRPFVVV